HDQQDDEQDRAGPGGEQEALPPRPSCAFHVASCSEDVTRCPSAGQWRSSPTRTILGVLVPPELPIGSPIVSTTRSPGRTWPLATRRSSAPCSTASRSSLCSKNSGRTLR